MKYKLLYLILFTLSAQFLAASTSMKDSLIRAASDASKSHAEVAQIYLDLVDLFVSENPDSALYYNTQAEKLADEMEHEGSFPDSLCTWIKAMSITNYGMIAYVKGSFIDALNFNNDALTYWEEIDDHLGLGLSYNNLAVIYENAGETEEAKKYFLKALQSMRNSGNRSKIAMIYNNLANLYQETGDYRQALNYAYIAKELREDPLDPNGYANVLNNIGVIYMDMNKLDSAEIALLEALDLVQKNKNLRGQSYVETHLAELYLAMGDQEKARSYGESALELADQFKSLSNVTTSASVLATVYAQAQEWQKAYEMQKLYTESYEKMKLSELNKELIRGEIQFDFEKKRLVEETEAEKKQAMLQVQMVSLGVIALILLIFSTLLYKRHLRLKKQKALIEEQSEERKVLLQEIHHRVKNNFQVISSLLKLQSKNLNNDEAVEALEDAVNRIYAMASVHESIYQKEKFTSLDYKSYLEKVIENLEYSFNNERVKITSELPEDVASVKLTIPLSIILNELITNSFKHAFPDDHPDPAIFIRLRKEDGEFVLTYKDNGIGLGSSGMNFGMELIHTMVDQLNGTIEIHSEGTWKTVISVRFPENQED